MMISKVVGTPGTDPKGSEKKTEGVEIRGRIVSLQTIAFLRPA